ncbi:DUF2480 family protein [Persicobacter psychrovividus]|uniref:DUF2480 family protein n=1 Tax=Persicobacter psychrovividus TaxID=387638 RepID=A0ABM7VGX5_9BACT|nr:hypothetical protein PEPS_24840 [Persicobacter psychrovividus]
MSANDQIINRVESSGLLQIDLEEFRPAGERVAIDIADQLFQGLVLREKDFRTYIKETDWSTFQDKHVALFCSADAIIPNWAFMLLASKLQAVATTVEFGDLEQLETALYKKALAHIDYSKFQDERVVIKGCSDEAVPTSAYVLLTNRLTPYVKSIMFGEPCSTVPVYKKPRVKK